VKSSLTDEKITTILADVTSIVFLCGKKETIILADRDSSSTQKTFLEIIISIIRACSLDRIDINVGSLGQFWEFSELAINIFIDSGGLIIMYESAYSRKIVCTYKGEESYLYSDLRNSKAFRHYKLR
jgi:hypothetical protein